PSAQVCVAAKVRDGAEGLQESLLRQVARFFRVFRQAIEQRVDVGRTLAHEKIERGGVAGPQSVKELGFGTGRHIAVLGHLRGRLQLGLPTEGDWLSEAHKRPPSASARFRSFALRAPHSQTLRQWV